jgi:hypothetical protein
MFRVFEGHSCFSINREDISGSIDKSTKLAGTQVLGFYNMHVCLKLKQQQLRLKSGKKVCEISAGGIYTKLKVHTPTREKAKA